MRTIIEMVNMTRLDCALMAAGGMRIGTAHAVHHATHRSVFGKRLLDQPAMVNVLADLAVDSRGRDDRRAAAWPARSTGRHAATPARRHSAGSASSVTKYWLCKRWSTHAAESLECLGGNGYVEDSGLPRLYREAPLVSIWEGSGNVAALDTLRAMAQGTGGHRGVLRRARPGRGHRRRATTTRWPCCARSSATPTSSSTGRGTSSSGWRMLLQGSLLLRHGDPAVADAFVASRLAGDWGVAYGTLPTGLDTATILDRASVLG